LADKKKVLVVDDELDMRIFIATLMETGGYRATVCRDGRAGIRKAKEIFPDLIVLDVMMPGDGGVKMYRDLKTDSALKNIPVLMLTGVGKKSFSHYIRMLKVGIETPIPNPDAYIEKPPDPEHLLNTARRLLADA